MCNYCIFFKACAGRTLTLFSFWTFFSKYVFLIARLESGFDFGEDRYVTAKFYLICFVRFALFFRREEYTRAKGVGMGTENVYFEEIIVWNGAGAPQPHSDPRDNEL